MNEALATSALFDLAKNFGVGGLMLLYAWMQNQQTTKLLARYHADMEEQRQMFVQSYALVKKFAHLATDLKDVVIMNTQANTGLKDTIESNQYCPNVRLQKKAQGVTK